MEELFTEGEDELVCATMEELFTDLSKKRVGTFSTHRHIKGKKLSIVSVGENAYLLNWDNQDVIHLNWFYGDPTCGLISKDGSWAVIAGDFELTIWHEDVVTTIDTFPVFDMQQKDAETVRILGSLLYRDTAVWELNIRTMERKQVGAYTRYFNKAYLKKCRIVGHL